MVTRFVEKSTVKSDYFGLVALHQALKRRRFAEICNRFLPLGPSPSLEPTTVSKLYCQ
jgi:hypothetical protein